MAWTAPRTWVTGEVVTAAIMNTHIRDNLKAIGDPWTAYTPVWTAATTNPVLGNGSFTGSAYVQVGKTVHFRVVLTMGSTTTYGSGQYRLTLPAAPSGSTRVVFLVDMLDASAPAAYTGSANWDSATGVLTVTATPTTAGNANRSAGSTSPFTWATGDVLTITGTYEAA